MTSYLKRKSNNVSLKKVENFTTVDVNELHSVCKEFVSVHPFPKHNQLCFLNTKDCNPDPDQGTGNKLNPDAKMYNLNDEDFTEFHPMWKDTLLYDVYKNFPKPVTRMRLMQLNPKNTYSIHIDGRNEVRYHIAVQTTPDTYFMYGDTLELIHVPADGNAYEFNVERPHSFINFNRNNYRWHLVLNALVSC